MRSSSREHTQQAFAWRFDILFLALLLAGGAVRLYLALVTPDTRFGYDESDGAILLARSISFSPETLNLPLRGRSHPAMVGYVVKAGGFLFGTSLLGHRLFHLLLGLTAIVLTYSIARHWYGVVAARWAAAVLTFNEYHLRISSIVTSHAVHLFFVGLAVFTFHRLLATGRAAFFYWTAVATGAAYYCKEHSVLLLPVFLVSLSTRTHRHWLRTPHPYAACLLFALLVAPDAYWNFNPDSRPAGPTAEAIPAGPAEDKPLAPFGQATWADHAARIGGLGVSLYPVAFYLRSAVWRLPEWLYFEYGHEYESMNLLLGALLLWCCGNALVRRRPDPVHAFLVALFGIVFVFFVLIRPGNPGRNLDPSAWVWVDMTIYPAVILAGARIANAGARTRVALAVVATAGMLVAATTMATWTPP